MNACWILYCILCCVIVCDKISISTFTGDFDRSTMSTTPNENTIQSLAFNAYVPSTNYRTYSRKFLMMQQYKVSALPNDIKTFLSDLQILRKRKKRGRRNNPGNERRFLRHLSPNSCEYTSAEIELPTSAEPAIRSIHGLVNNFAQPIPVRITYREDHNHVNNRVAHAKPPSSPTVVTLHSPKKRGK